MKFRFDRITHYTRRPDTEVHLGVLATVTQMRFDMVNVLFVTHHSEPTPVVSFADLPKWAGKSTDTSILLDSVHENTIVSSYKYCIKIPFYI